MTGQPADRGPWHCGRLRCPGGHPRHDSPGCPPDELTEEELAQLRAEYQAQVRRENLRAFAWEWHYYGGMW